MLRPSDCLLGVTDGRWREHAFPLLLCAQERKIDLRHGDAFELVLSCLRTLRVSGSERVAEMPLFRVGEALDDDDAFGHAKPELQAGATSPFQVRQRAPSTPRVSRSWSLPSATAAWRRKRHSPGRRAPPWRGR